MQVYFKITHVDHTELKIPALDFIWVEYRGSDGFTEDVTMMDAVDALTGAGMDGTLPGSSSGFSNPMSNPLATKARVAASPSSPPLTYGTPPLSDADGGGYGDGGGGGGGGDSSSSHLYPPTIPINPLAKPRTAALPSSPPSYSEAGTLSTVPTAHSSSSSLLLDLDYGAIYTPGEGGEPVHIRDDEEAENESDSLLPSPPPARATDRLEVQSTTSTPLNYSF